MGETQVTVSEPETSSDPVTIDPAIVAVSETAKDSAMAETAAVQSAENAEHSTEAAQVADNAANDAARARDETATLAAGTMAAIDAIPNRVAEALASLIKQRQPEPSPPTDSSVQEEKPETVEPASAEHWYTRKLRLKKG